MPLNTLTDETRRGADRTHVWFNVILGYCLALSIAFDHAWMSDPTFTTVRQVPYSQAVWAGALAVVTTIYTVGSFMPHGRPGRGVTIIAGASLCFWWYFLFAMALVRETYVSPRDTSSLWPLVMIFISALYGHRAVLYLNMFTGTRWTLNPFQLYAVTFLMLLSIAQVVIGVSPTSVQAEFDRGTQLSLAGANFVGAVVVMAGLHLRQIEKGLWIELWGYASLTLTMLFYIFAQLSAIRVPIATLGFTLSEAFAFASLHRAIQIAAYKFARRNGGDAHYRLRLALGHRTKAEIKEVFVATQDRAADDKAETEGAETEGEA